MYRLVIAEKPSVAMSIAKVLGASAYDPKYDKWRREDLPILPEDWRFAVGWDKREQFDMKEFIPPFHQSAPLA